MIGDLGLSLEGYAEDALGDGKDVAGCCASSGCANGPTSKCAAATTNGAGSALQLGTTNTFAGVLVSTNNAKFVAFMRAPCRRILCRGPAPSA